LCDGQNFLDSAGKLPLNFLSPELTWRYVLNRDCGQPAVFSEGRIMNLKRRAAAGGAALALSAALALAVNLYPAAANASTSAPAVPVASAVDAGTSVPVALLALGTSANTSGPAARVASAAARSVMASGLGAVPQASGDGCTTDSAGETYCQYTVSPRGTCGGYNGHVYWEDDWYGTIYIGTYGEVWSTCDVSAYIYLHWEQDAGARKYNDQAGSATEWNTSGVNYIDDRPAESIGGMSSVNVTICGTYNGGWHCGTSQYV
jgi:hypothetical protein